jgi:hypothetical protein
MKNELNENELNEKEKKYVWQPNLKWFLTVLITMYVLITIAFFTVNFLLKPYMRDIPKEITPWLDKIVAGEQK